MKTTKFFLFLLVFTHTCFAQVVLENCSITNSSDVAYDLQSVSDVLLKGCVAACGSTDGFNLEAVENALLCDCVAHANDGIGFNFDADCNAIELIASKAKFNTTNIDDNSIDGANQVNIEIIQSKVCNIDMSLPSIGDALCSKLELVEDKLDVLTDSTLDSLVEITEDLNSVCDKVLNTMMQIDSVSDNIVDQLSDLDSMITMARDDIIEAVCSKQEILEEDLFSVSDFLCDKINGLGAADLSSQLDVIEDKVDALSCPSVITQADIPLTITTPGLYCLGEDITDSGVPITINSSGVRLDLNYRTITVAAATAAIATAASLSNISIKNGAIIGHAGLVRAIQTNNVTNLEVENVDFRVGQLGIQTLNGAGSNDTVTIKNCTFKGFTTGAISMIAGTSIFIENVEATDSEVGVAFTTGCSNALVKNVFVSNATDNAFYVIDSATTDIIFQDCIALDTNGRGFSIAGSRIVLENCKALNGSEEGIITEATADDFCMRNCITKNNTFSNIVIRGDNSTIENCQSVNSGGFGFRIEGSQVIVRSCISHASTSVGFSFVGVTATFQDCEAMFGDTSGFVLGDPNVLTYEQACIVDNCKAVSNMDSGFIVEQDATCIRNSIAQKNRLGFCVHANRVSVDHCKALNHGSTGFLLCHQGVRAEYDSLGFGSPAVGSWEIITNNRVNFSHNVSLDNPKGYVMEGESRDKNMGPARLADAYFTAVMYPPIGMVVGTAGTILPDDSPIPTPSVTPYVGANIDLDYSPYVATFTGSMRILVNPCP